MSFTFRPAVRENVGLLLGVIGASGAGKSFSAMRLASGMAGGKRFALIDTENGRALHYADRFSFDHGDLRAPFSPDHYQEAILAADQTGYPVIVVDSFSHEHAGDGGILDMQEAELERMAGSDFKRREACKMAAWIKPKTSHKRMVSKLLQVRAHLILCLRAEEKIEMVKDGSGKLVIQPKRSLTGLSGWIPICEKTLPYELTASFLLTPDKPGVPQPIKLQEQHKAYVSLAAPLDEKTGQAMAEWARGGAVPAEPSDLVRKAEAAAHEGTAAIEKWWGTLTVTDRKALSGDRARLRKIAEEADANQSLSADDNCDCPDGPAGNHEATCRRRKMA